MRLWLSSCVRNNWKTKKSFVSFKIFTWLERLVGYKRSSWEPGSSLFLSSRYWRRKKVLLTTLTPACRAARPEVSVGLCVSRWWKGWERGNFEFRLAKVGRCSSLAEPALESWRGRVPGWGLEIRPLVNPLTDRYLEIRWTPNAIHISDNLSVRSSVESKMTILIIFITIGAPRLSA